MLSKSLCSAKSDIIPPLRVIQHVVSCALPIVFHQETSNVISCVYQNPKLFLFAMSVKWVQFQVQKSKR